MKSEKATEADRPTRTRWYDDACGTAHAMELVGERWSILILRELMFGARRFGELRGGLPGISANTLTQRLEGLEAAGVLRRRRLPSPANAQVYELTEWGYEAEAAVQVLGRWAARSPGHDPTLPISPASVMMSLRTMIDPVQARGLSGRFAFRLGPDAFLARLEGGGLQVMRGEGDAEVTVTAEPAMLAAVIYLKIPADDAVRIEGDAALWDAFVDLFHLPLKAAVE